ncbi:hypothetical protein LNQ03_00645 [Klebsiella pneumoniae subsp. pneumoniae]|nr:hypothetical protein [Klebsiella pneumoniae subsp. pneumoniae]
MYTPVAQASPPPPVHTALAFLPMMIAVGVLAGGQNALWRRYPIAQELQRDVSASLGFRIVKDPATCC